MQQDCIHAITLKKNALRKQSENLSTPTRNYQLMTALMKNTKPHVSSQYLLGDMNDILHGNEKHLGVLKKYVRAVQHISQQYTGLYSIG